MMQLKKQKSQNTVFRRIGEKMDTDQISGYVFIFPFILGFIAFTAAPIVSSFFLSFTQYDGLSTPVWIGLDNYVRIFTKDPTFYKSMGVTFYYTFVSVPLKMVFALIVAMILTKPSRMLSVYRSVYYLPSMVGGSVAIAVVWRLMFQKEGLINNTLQAIGLDVRVGWLTQPDTALGILILLSVWQFGASMVIFLAGLKQIPTVYYEAAMVDGANSVIQFFKITLPMLTPVIFFNLIMQIISSFIAFTQAFIITQGKPLDSTLMATK